MEDWRVYDEVAETYERIHAPRFAEPAADLAAMANVTSSDVVLDLGTGTGVAGHAARELGAERVVGLDPAVGMLSVASRQRPGLLLTGGEAIDLPFRDGTFDVVLANFVIPNFRNHVTALADVLRVLRPGGRFAMSAWGDEVDHLDATWDEVANSMIPGRMLQQMRETEYPHFASFGSRNFTEETLARAGLKSIRTETRGYRFTYGLDEYLEGREVFKSGRFVRGMLGASGWETFRSRLRAVFAERFADPLQDSVSVLFATSTKPLP